ncbi:hypothetical protein TWF281_001545 [Arthrobotrys megalospora]
MKRFRIPKASVLNNEVTSLFVNISIGTPPQSIALAVSFLPLTWALTPGLPVSEFCAVPGNLFTCRTGRWSGYFDPSKSSSFGNASAPLNITYDSTRYVRGAIHTEVLHLDGYTVPLPIGFARSIILPPTLGLGIFPETQVTNYTALPRILYDEGRIPTIIFGIYVNPNRKSIENPGEICFGAADTDKFYGAMTTVEMSGGGIIEPARVELLIESEKGRGVEVTDMVLKVGKLGLDPALDGIYIVNNPTLHTTILSVLTDSLYTYEEPIEAYITPCNSTSPITNRTLQFTFGTANNEVKIKVTAEQLIYRLADGRCYIGVYNGPYDFQEVGRDAFDINLGLSFFRSAYLLFDQTNNQLSIAASIPDSSTQNLVDVNSVMRASQLVGTGPTPVERLRPAATGPNINIRTVGIAVGITAGVLLVSGLLFLLWKRGKRRHKKEENFHWEGKFELEGSGKPGRRVQIELVGTQFVEADEGRKVYELPGLVTITSPEK